MPYENGDDITPKSISRSLTKLITPFYKGFPDPVTQKPEFRKSLTGQEINELLMHLHVIITSIELKERDKRSTNGSQ